MKTGLLPGINLLLTIIAVALTFVPISLYWWKKLAPSKPFLVISIFWAINGILYTPEIFHFEWYKTASNQITLYYNLIDSPLIILFFYYTFRKKFFIYLLLSFIIFEVALVACMGFNFGSNNFIIGLGSLISLTLNVWGISKYFMKMQHNDTENVLVFVFAGFIFYYGLFAVVFRYNYLRTSGPELPYVIFINYLAICICTSLITYGFWKYAHANYQDERY